MDHARDEKGLVARIGGDFSFDDMLNAVERFHGYAAPGVLIGCYMVAAAKSRLPQDVLYDAICETGWCLPDASQLMTPCTTGNGWLRIVNLGLYALTLYEKATGKGFRVYLDAQKLAPWPDVSDWYLKRKPKREQDSEAIRRQIREAGDRMYQVTAVEVRAEFLNKRSKGAIRICPLCQESYPEKHGEICRKCQGQSPYEGLAFGLSSEASGPGLQAIDATQAVGRSILHDMTRIVPGDSKGPAFKRGQPVTAGDVCRLQAMGRNRLYVEAEGGETADLIHEDHAADAFARAMAGEGTCPEDQCHEGKVNILADRDGMLVVDVDRLVGFNLLPDVMAASRKSFSLVKKDSVIAGTRAIPLFITRSRFHSALSHIGEEPFFHVRPMAPLRVGILVTGTEVFQGLIQDRFEGIITGKVRAYGCEVVGTRIVPDDRKAIADAIRHLLEAGAQLIVTTAGLSVDPDDVTRQGLSDAGAADMLYGAGVLPGAMTLLARIGDARVIGVPACALHFKTTSFDVILPRVLAGIRVTRKDLAQLAHGGLCMQCRTCSYPKCPFGK